MTQKLQTLPELKKTLLDKKLENGASWRVISTELYPDENPRIWRSILWRIAKADYEPKNNRLRKRLGLPFIKTITACPDCNEIHLSGCPDAELPTRGKTAVVPVCPKCGEPYIGNHRCKRTSTNHRPRPPRIAIRLDNPESAACSIRGSMDRELIRELVKLLNTEMNNDK